MGMYGENVIVIISLLSCVPFSLTTEMLLTWSVPGEHTQVFSSVNVDVSAVSSAQSFPPSSDPSRKTALSCP